MWPGPDACTRHGHRPSLGCGECMTAEKDWRDFRFAVGCCLVLLGAIAAQWALSRMWP